MPGEGQEQSPAALIGVGVCFMGAGVTMGLALRESGFGLVGIGLVLVGVLFVIAGAIRKRTEK